MGKHSTSNTRTISRLAATAAATVAIPGMVAVGTAGEAHAAANWDPIIQCESGGNPTAQNPVSTASGLFQFIDGTWKAYGGSTAKAKHASVAEQYAVANRAYAAEGYRPWAASNGCHGLLDGTPKKVAPVEIKQEVPKQAEKTQKVETVEAKPASKAEPTKTAKAEKTTKIEKPKAAPVKVTPAPVVPAGASYTPDGDGLYTVQLGDTLTSLAKDNGTTVQALMDLNKDIIEMPDWIFAGERIHLK